MKLFKIEVKNSIPDALEYIYQYTCLDDDGSIKQDIPYYMRSSNMNIKCIGTIEMEKYPYNVEDHILMIDYWEP